MQDRGGNESGPAVVTVRVTPGQYPSLVTELWKTLRLDKADGPQLNSLLKYKQPKIATLHPHHLVKMYRSRTGLSPRAERLKIPCKACMCPSVWLQQSDAELGGVPPVLSPYAKCLRGVAIRWEHCHAGSQLYACFPTSLAYHIRHRMSTVVDGELSHG
ncbi:uncharacterized protein BDR25DRAFT_350986 [Lindgomyces ingoldianus]|uniref:Uncharacterized protein n=1 Tax=Lindgomyces ingoldianus TaxID=673940 RepID=A0ACB6R5M0_9PLEO|nr:uncharacterized protein BDR25DRAFT_350986 [Lindgomyces ingoldianus]KAF2474466.1 hypothetical protein BDR25DRAFT_350986 [Lindgomyces ingoldianus]